MFQIHLYISKYLLVCVLDSSEACGFIVDIHHGTYFDGQLHSASQEDLVCFVQDLIAVLDQFVGIPCEEEFPLLGLVCSIVRKELGFLRSVVVLPSVIRQFPLRMPSLCCCSFEVCFQFPAEINTWIKIGELDCLCPLHGYISFCSIEVKMEEYLFLERALTMNSPTPGSPLEERLVVHSKREVLDVPHLPPVGVEDVGVGLANVPHPLRDRDVDDVANVASALVARHDGLQLQAGLPHQLEHLLVGAPVVDPGRLPFHQPPPDVDHDPVGAGLHQLLQLRPRLIGLLERVVDVDDIQLYVPNTKRAEEERKGAWGPIYTGELGRGGRGLLQRRTSDSSGTSCPRPSPRKGAGAR